MKAAIYLRQSQDRDGNQLGVDRQRQDCVKLCEAKGWGWAEYVDNDTSATSRKPRPAYQAMLTDIRNGSIGGVVVWHLDRLHRQPRELEDFIDLADAHHLALASVTGDINLASDNGRLIARITGAVARAEHERKVERMNRRYRQDREAGKAHSAGGKIAFGYTSDNHLDPTTAPAVRQAYFQVQEGRSLMGLARDWNDKGFTSATGKAWDSTAVRTVLLNPRNAGLASYRREVLEDVKASWPAIVDREVFDAVRVILTDPDRTQPRSAGRKYLLTGLAVCGHCGHTLGSGSPARAGGPVRYVCKKCHHVARKIVWVDEYVLSAVAERLSRPDAIDLLTKKDTPDLPALRAKATALRAKKVELADMWAADEMDRAQFTRASAKLDGQLAELDAATLDTSRARVLDGLAAGDAETVRERLDALPLDRARAVVETLLTVTVLPGTQPRGKVRTELLAIEWKGEDQ
jgi:DNA invertase Pin-like site-specific DNA recombinase